MTETLKLEKLSTLPQTYNNSTLYFINADNKLNISLSNIDANAIYKLYNSVSISDLIVTYINSIKDQPGGIASLDYDSNIVGTFLPSPTVKIIKPVINSPDNNANELPNNILITTLSFSTIYGSITHDSSSWQIATDANFINIVQEAIDSTLYKTEWSVTDLLFNKVYYVRMRFKNNTIGYSEWSNTNIIATKVTSGFPIPRSEEAILTASDKVTLDNYSRSVSIDSTGTRIIIGSPLADPIGTTNGGKAYIYVRSGTTWTQEAILIASDKVNSAQFGFSVSIDSLGNRVIISAIARYLSGVPGAGQAYVFTRSGTTWTQEAMFSASDKFINDYFGRTVAISGDGTRVIVGASEADHAGLVDCGKAYIFSRSGTVWTQEAILTASDKVTLDYFGWTSTIDANGTRVAIGAYGADPSGLSAAGKAYVYVRSGTVWTEEAILTASDKAANNQFGRAAAINANGTRLVIGAFQATVTGAANAGKAYTFVRSGTTWTQEAILSASDRLATDKLGISASISDDGNRIAIGAYLSDPFGVIDAGKAYIFNLTNNIWKQESIITASDLETINYFGYSVSLAGDGSRVVIGAYLADPSGLIDAGKAYVYS